MTRVRINELTVSVSPSNLNHFQVITAAKPHHVHTF